MKQRTLLFVFLLLSTLTARAQTLIDGIYYNLYTSTNNATVTYGDTKYTGSITIPSTVTFENVTYNVTSVGYNAFKSCSSLTKVIIPNSVTSIANEAFKSCSGLTSITIPNSVTSLGAFAFQYCSSLTSVTIPSSVTFIGDNPFSSCSGLTSISVESGNTVYDSRDNCNAIICYNTLIVGCINTIIPNSVTSIGNYAFTGCSGLTEVTIPNGVTSIGEKAFQYCSNLTSIKFPSSVTSFRNYVFSGCSGLTDVYCYAVNVPSTDSKTFNGLPFSSATLHVPATSLETYKTTEPWSKFSNFVAMDEYEPAAESIAIDETNFPDENFRKWILSQKYGQDGMLTKDEVSNITRLDVGSMNIKNLIGIENFIELTDLFCSNNQLVSLDLSNNKKLTGLWCNNNQLEALDVSKNTVLTGLACYCNQIKGKAMDSLIASLPNGGNLLFVINNEDRNEGNEMTTTQVATTKAKGWIPKYYDGTNWLEYVGNKCATPTISYADGKVTFSCETEGVEYEYNITSAKSGSGTNISMPTTYKVTVFATKDGYENSDTATMEIEVSGGSTAKKGDVNSDGIVNGTDIQEVINIIVSGE